MRGYRGRGVKQASEEPYYLTQEIADGFLVSSDEGLRRVEEHEQFTPVLDGML